MSDESSGSDFDDDEDPDKIEVPGKIFKYIFLLMSSIFNPSPLY